MQKNINSSSFTEMSSKNNDMPPPYPPNKSLIGGISSSFNTYLSYKSLNLSKSPIKTNTKILSEELSQTNSYKNSSYSNYYNHINNFNFLYSRKNSEINKNENLSNIYNDDNKIILKKKYIKKEEPKTDEEIKIFVDELLEYINYIESLKVDKYKIRNLMVLKAKIEVRNIDYINSGLKKEYYIDCLMKMQSELIAFICKYNEQLIYDKNGNSKSVAIDENKDFFSLF
jgi:hypothetical protein